MKRTLNDCQVVRGSSKNWTDSRFDSLIWLLLSNSKQSNANNTRTFFEFLTTFRFCLPPAFSGQTAGYGATCTEMSSKKKTATWCMSCLFFKVENNSLELTRIFQNIFIDPIVSARKKKKAEKISFFLSLFMSTSLLRLFFLALTIGSINIF